MDIIKAFQKNEIGLNITIKGTYDEPLFRASDIGLVLEISKIRNTIQDFDDTEKVACTVGTLGGNQEVTFLTEKGLYQVLFTSRKPIAKTFKNWVCDVIKEIRINGKYNLEKQLEEKDDILEKTLIDKYSDKVQCIYYGTVDNIGENKEKLIKFGQTNHLCTRIRNHKNCFDNFKLKNVFKVNNCQTIETEIKHDAILNIRMRSASDKYNNTRNEMLMYDDNFTLEMIDKRIKIIIENCELNPVSLLHKINEQEIEIKNLRNELKCIKLGIQNENIVMNKNNIKCPDCDRIMAKKSSRCRMCANKITSQLKKKEIPIKKCSGCSSQVYKTSTKCRSCSSKMQKRKIENRPSLEQLEKDLVELETYVSVGNKYNVSDNSIRKWIKNYKLISKSL